jgi:hypothetical protein
MANKKYYKKIFIAAAALFILFAPVGITTKSATQSPSTAIVLATNAREASNNSLFSLSSYSTFRLSLRLNLVEAADTTVGAGAGVAQVQTPNWLSCASNPATCGVYYISLVVNGGMGLFVALGAWLVRLGLQFNDNIFNSPAVTTGFSVALAIANLGFVLGIIIIAIATIIRNQSYGIKQLLWKLVMMAILVNFGLVITAPIVGFANSMSNYFINATSPSGAAGYEGYVATMMTAFSPQTQQLGGVSSNSGSGNSFVDFCKGNWSWISEVQDMCNTAGVPTNATDNFWQTTIAFLFDIVFSALTAFTFLCLAILLIIRYLTLAGLLIVLPLAWLMYIFPKFDNSFSKWWNTFIKWTFFPPLALFFIYLAFITATNTTSNQPYLGSALAVPSGATTGVEKTLTTQTGLGEGVVQQAADEVLLVGLTIMGLIFASSLAGKAGSTAVNIGSSAGKAVAGYAGRKAKKGVARAYQGAGGERLNTALQRSRIPLISTIGRGAANLTEAGTKNQVDAYHKSLGLGNMDDARLTAVTQGLSGKDKQLAALMEWQKRGKLDKVEKIGGASLQEWLSKNQDTFKNYGQGKLQGDIDTALGSNEEIRRAARAKGAAGATATMVDENGIMGPAGATVLASDMTSRANEVMQKAAEAKNAARTTATVVDEKGVVGPVGATVLASDMTSRANEVAKNAETLVKRSGADSFVPHNGSTIKAGDLLKIAQAASKGAEEAMDKNEETAGILHNGKIRGAGDLAQEAKMALQKADAAVDKKGGDANVRDEENRLGRGAGQMVKAGELMQAAAEKFWEGKDKGDISKISASALFGGKAKFGLDEKSLKEIGRSVTHGIAMQAPGLMGSVAGKMDNWKQLTEFTNTYKRSIDEAERANKMTAIRAESLRGSIDKILGAKLAFLGGPAPTPTPPTP